MATSAARVALWSATAPLAAIFAQAAVLAALSVPSSFFEKITDLSLLIFTLFSSPFCMKCIEFTTRTVELSRTELGTLPPLVLEGIIENQNSDFVTP
jgi:hypothetical protein